MHRREGDRPPRALPKLHAPQRMQKPPQSLQTIEHHARIAIRGTQGHSVYRKVVPDPQAEHHARIAAEFESLIKPHTALGVFGHKGFGRVAEAQPKGFCDDVGAAGGLAKRSSNKLVLSDDPRGGSAPGIGDARGSKAGCCSVRFAKRSSIVFLSSTSTSDTVRALWPKAPRASVRAKRAPNESSRLGADVCTEEAALCTFAWLEFRVGWLTRVRRSSASSRVGGRGRCSVTSVVAPCAPASGFGALGAWARSRRSRPISALAASSVFTSDAFSGPWQTSATSEPEARGDHACGADGRFAKRSSKVCLSSTCTSDTVRALWPKAPRASVRAKRAPNEEGSVPMFQK